MKTVLVRGPLLSDSGYGVHSRQVFQFCESQKDWKVYTQILPWGITPWNVDRESENGLMGRIMHASQPLPGKVDITFQVQLPHEWDVSLGNFNVGVTAGVETDRCSEDWARVHREKMNVVIVPSEFSKSAFLVSGTKNEKTPIRVVPEAYFPEILEESSEDILSHLPTNQNFLLVGTLVSDDPSADRKNIANAIIWFLQAFKDNKDVGLVVKTTKGRETSIDRELVRKMLRQIKKVSGAGDFPRIYMLHGPMTRKEMTNLYKSPKVCGFMSATRGEGFGLPLLESAVAGLPIVATDWSAHTEFLSGPSFLKVACDMNYISDSRVDGTIFVKNSIWANPREGNFKRNLKKALEENSSLREAAKDLSSKLVESHSLKNIFEIYRNSLPEIFEK